MNIINNMERKYLSSYEELQQRKDPLYGDKAKIYEIHKSQLKEDLYIVIMKDGSQACVNTETFNKLK